MAVGLTDGQQVGLLLGIKVGARLGIMVGFAVGNEGLMDGIDVGLLVPNDCGRKNMTITRT